MQSFTSSGYPPDAPAAKRMAKWYVVTLKKIRMLQGEKSGFLKKPGF